MDYLDVSKSGLLGPVRTEIHSAPVIDMGGAPQKD